MTPSNRSANRRLFAGGRLRDAPRPISSVARALVRTRQMSLRAMRALRFALLVVALGFLATGAARAADYSKTVGGYTIYLGVLPAGVLFLYRPDHGDPTVHSGPRFGDAHHVLVGLVDATRGSRIDDAEITARIVPTKGEPQERRLERMSVEGGAAYGNFFALRRDRHYRIDLTIRRPGSPSAVKASFDYVHRL